MNYLDLSENYLPSLPSIPNFYQTLLLIQSQQILQHHSQMNLHQEPVSEPFMESLSIQLEMYADKDAHVTNCSASLIRKKKGGCTCKKSKCLKMYCECFASGKMCTSQCSCISCCNNQQHKTCSKKQKDEAKLDRKDGHVGCRCKKSQCQKKYCECFSAGVACGAHCKCQDCLNGKCSSHKSSEAQMTQIVDHLDKQQSDSIFCCLGN